MYGAIIGDIVGSIYEFTGNKKKMFPLFSPYCKPTDDSVMTVAVAEVLLSLSGEESDDVVKKRLIESMKAWGLRYPRAGYGGRFGAWLRAVDSRPYNSFGNGSAMRVSACGWLYDDIDAARKMARLSAEVTHNHSEGIKGAESIASAIFMARTGASKEDIKNYITREFGYDLNRTCDDIRPIYSFDVTCQGSVPESIIAFMDGEDYEDVIRNAISLGGDTDTQAAIAGSIAEAFYGIRDEIIINAKQYIPEDIQSVIDGFYNAIGKTEITVTDRFSVNQREVCMFQISYGIIEEYIKRGSLWERQDGEMFIVDAIIKGTNCWEKSYSQIGIVFKSSSGEHPMRGDVLKPSFWKYGISPSKKGLFKRVQFVEEVFKKYGAIQTELNAEQRLKFGYRPIYERNGEYYRADFIPFNDKPYLVIEWSDDKTIADNGTMEDVDPFPYDLDDERLEKEVRYAMEIEPYPDKYPD